MTDEMELIGLPSIMQMNGSNVTLSFENRVKDDVQNCCADETADFVVNNELPTMVSHESFRFSKMAMLSEDDDSKDYSVDDSKETPLAYGTDVPKNKDTELKKVRRRIKNKLSAQESRRRKKEYIDNLEKRNKFKDRENAELKQGLEVMEEKMRSLVDEMFKMKQESLNKLQMSMDKPCVRQTRRITRATQTGICLQCYLQSNSPPPSHSISRPPSWPIVPLLTESQPSCQDPILSSSESSRQPNEEPAQEYRGITKEQIPGEDQNRGLFSREEIRNHALPSCSGAQIDLNRPESLDCLRRGGEKRSDLFQKRSHSPQRNSASEQIVGLNRNRSFLSSDEKINHSLPSYSGAQRHLNRSESLECSQIYPARKQNEEDNRNNGFPSSDKKLNHALPSYSGAQRHLNRSESLECFRRSDKWSGLSRKRSHSSHEIESSLGDNSKREYFDKNPVDNDMVVYSSQNVILIKEPRKNKRKNTINQPITADDGDQSNVRQDAGQGLNSKESNMSYDGESNNAITNQINKDPESRIESNHQSNQYPHSNHKSPNDINHNAGLTENGVLRNQKARKHDVEQQGIINANQGIISANHKENQRSDHNQSIASKQCSRERHKELKNVTAALHALGKHADGVKSSFNREDCAPRKPIDMSVRGLKPLEQKSKNFGTVADSDGTSSPCYSSDQKQLVDMKVPKKKEKVKHFDEKEFTAVDYDHSEDFFKGQNRDNAELKTVDITDVSCLSRDSNHERLKDKRHLHERSKDIGHLHERSKDKGHLDEEVKDKSKNKDHSPQKKYEGSRSKNLQPVSTNNITSRLKNMAKPPGINSTANKSLSGKCEDNITKSVPTSFFDTNKIERNMSDQTMGLKRTTWVEKPGDFSNDMMPYALQTDNDTTQRTGDCYRRENGPRANVYINGAPIGSKIENSCYPQAGNVPRGELEKLTNERVEIIPSRLTAQLSKRERKTEIFSPEKGTPIDNFKNVCGRVEPTATEMMKYLTTLHHAGNGVIDSAVNIQQRELEMPGRHPGLLERLPIPSGLQLSTQPFEGTLKNQFLNNEFDMNQAITPRLPLLSWPSPELSLFNRPMLPPGGPVFPVPLQSPGDNKFLSPGIPLPLAYQLQQLNQWNMFRQDLLGSPMIPELKSFSSQLNES